MISWLKGQIIENWRISSKHGIVIACSGVGYEVQLLEKQLRLMDSSEIQEIWIHQINREDSINLYGFKQINQRDLFRQLISVSGIGPQIGMALLDDYEVEELTEAIKENNIKLLIKSQGVGKRIAERLVVELKNKLKLFNTKEENNLKNQSQKNLEQYSPYLNEIKSILNSLGYLDNEIAHSLEILKIQEKTNLEIINGHSSEDKNNLMDKHLKEILTRLSKKEHLMELEGVN